MAITTRLRYRILGHRGRAVDRLPALVLSAPELAGEGNLMNIHDKAPDFTLQDENGKEVSSQDLRGRTVVLFFYPRADTPG
jgi:peroxiredoxin